jgi:hypothetical protein
MVAIARYVFRIMRGERAGVYKPVTIDNLLSMRQS